LPWRQWPVFEAARAETPALDRPRLEAFVDGAVHEAMRSRHIAGVTVAIVDRSGVAMARGYGIAALSPRKAVDADTLFASARSPRRRFGSR